METMEMTEPIETAEDYSPRMVAADVAVPDFTAKWDEIRQDLDGEAACALRIGQNLIEIRDALKPLGLWLGALREHGMSQSQAWRYIKYAELDPRDRAIYQRGTGFSLSEAIGERRKKGDAAKASAAAPDEVQIAAEQLAEIDRRLKLAVRMVEAGERTLDGEPGPSEYADDQERWRLRLSAVAEDQIEAIKSGSSLEAVLKKRLLPGGE